jgi:hypothetical protein
MTLTSLLASRLTEVLVSILWLGYEIVGCQHKVIGLTGAHSYFLGISIQFLNVSLHSNPDLSGLWVSYCCCYIISLSMVSSLK